MCTVDPGVRPSASRKALGMEIRPSGSILAFMQTDCQPLQVAMSHSTSRVGGEVAGAGEHRVEHGFGQPAGERVLLAHVIAGEHGPTIHLGLDAVPELG